MGTSPQNEQTRARAARGARAWRGRARHPETRSRYPHEFSGGQRQRIALARAVVLEPTFIVLDEPTSALDMLIQAQMVDLLRELQKRCNLTYLFISHDLRVVAALASRLLVMRHGKIMEEGPARRCLKARRATIRAHCSRRRSIWRRRRRPWWLSELDSQRASHPCAAMACAQSRPGALRSSARDDADELDPAQMAAATAAGRRQLILAGPAPARLRRSPAGLFTSCSKG